MRSLSFRRIQSNRADRKTAYRLNRENISRRKSAKRHGFELDPRTKPSRSSRCRMGEVRNYEVATTDLRSPKDWVDYRHLHEKVMYGGELLMEAHPEVNLAWNFYSDLPPCSGQGHWEKVTAALRFAGWLRAVAEAEASELKEVLRLLQKTQSDRGVRSPRTTVSLGQLVGKWHSPHELEKWLRHTKWRANQILAPYGVKVAMADLYSVAEEKGNKRVGKGAFVAAARTLARYVVDRAHYGLGTVGYRYVNKGVWQAPPSVVTRESRQEIFEKARGLALAFKADRKVYLAAKALVQSGQAKDFRAALQQLEKEFTVDSTDGVEGFVGNETSALFRGLSVQRMILFADIRRRRGSRVSGQKAEFGWFVRSSEGESFHSTLGRPRDAAREAIAAWRRQRAMSAEGLSGLSEAMRHLGLNPDMMSVYVKVEDSYSAGNCQPGTSSWMRQNEFNGRKFIGAPILARFWSDLRVRRVILQAITRVAKGMLEEAT